MNKIMRKFGTADGEIYWWYFLQPNGLLGQFDELESHICSEDLTPKEAAEFKGYCSDENDKSVDMLSADEVILLVNTALNEESLPAVFSQGIIGTRYEVALKRTEINVGLNSMLNTKYSIEQPKTKESIEQFILEKHNAKNGCDGIYTVNLSGETSCFLSVKSDGERLSFQWSEELKRLPELFKCN